MTPSINVLKAFKFLPDAKLRQQCIQIVQELLSNGRLGDA